MQVAAGVVRVGQVHQPRIGVLRRLRQGVEVRGQHAWGLKIAGLDQLAALALGKIAKGGVGAGGAHHRIAGFAGGAQGQRHQAVGAGIHQQRLKGHALLGAQALANSQRLGIAVAVNVRRQGIAKVLAQGAVGHIQALVGAHLVGNRMAKLALQHLDAGERVMRAFAG